MAAGFTVIMRVRQHFGDDPRAFALFPFGVVIDDAVGASVTSAAANAPFVGATKDYTFDCPDVDPRRDAVLMFQSLGVQHEGNEISVNPGTRPQPSVFGGIPVIPAASGMLPAWSANVMLVGPGKLLETGNVLRITSRSVAGSPVPQLDDFVIDNVVIMYQLGSDRVGSLPATDRS